MTGETIRYLGNNDPTTRIALEQIMVREEEHADDMKKLLETLSKDEPGGRSCNPDTSRGLMCASVPCLITR